MPFPSDLSLFTVNEKIILNRLVVDNSKDYVLNHLLFSADVSIDDDMVATLKSLASKIEKLSDSEWDDMKSYFPCQVPISEKDFDFVMDDEA